MRTLIAGTERLLSLVCGLGTMLSLGSLAEGLAPFFAGLFCALAFAAAAWALAVMALRQDRMAARARKRCAAARQCHARRQAAETSLARRSAPAARQQSKRDLRVA